MFQTSTIVRNRASSWQHLSLILKLKSRWDSFYEAFNHNPSNGSFQTMAYRPSTRTKCLNLRFLSYWAELLSQQLFIIRMVTLTCPATIETQLTFPICGWTIQRLTYWFYSNQCNEESVKFEKQKQKHAAQLQTDISKWPSASRR